MINKTPSFVDEFGIRHFWADQLGEYVTIPGGVERLGECPPYPVSVFIAGHDVPLAERICQEYCDEVGLCVTVTMTLYVYTGGQDFGLIIGLINYPRFPATPMEIFSKAEELAHRLIEGLNQQSATIQASDKVVWIGAPRHS